MDSGSEVENEAPHVTECAPADDATPYKQGDEVKKSQSLDVSKLEVPVSQDPQTLSMKQEQEDFEAHSIVGQLYAAVEEGSLSKVEEIILASSVDVNLIFSSAHKFVKRKHWGWCPLHLAATRSNTDVLKYLVAQGADVAAITEADGDTALHLAVKHGASDVVSFLLDCNVFLRDVQNSKGITPLLRTIFKSQLAFKGNYRRCADLLLSAGCNPNIAPPSKVTPLHIAVVKGDHFFVQTLLSHGAQVNAICGQGFSPLSMAVVNKFINNQIISDLLAFGADPSLHVNERTLLHIAVSRCDDRTIEAFLRSGADPNSKDSQGITPLNIAVEENNIKVVPILVAGGGDINYKRLPQSVSLLTQAAMKNSLAMVTLLLSLGASPYTETILWCTPLHLAVDNQSIKIVRELLRANAPLNTTSTAKCSLRPMTPMQLAMEHANMPIIRLLNQAGAVIQPSWLKPERLSLALSTKAHLVAELRELVSEVPTLLHLARMKVRECSGERLGQLVAYLKAGAILPEKLIAYLSLCDILDM